MTSAPSGPTRRLSAGGVLAIGLGLVVEHQQGVLVGWVGLRVLVFGACEHHDIVVFDLRNIEVAGQ